MVTQMERGYSEAEAGRSEGVQGHPWLHSELESAWAT